MSVSAIITDGGRCRHWGAAEKLRIVEETLVVATVHRREHESRLGSGCWYIRFVIEDAGQR